MGWGHNGQRHCVLSPWLEYDPSMIISGNNNFHNLKGNTNLKFTNADYSYRPQPVIHLMIEKTDYENENIRVMIYSHAAETAEDRFAEALQTNLVK